MKTLQINTMSKQYPLYIGKGIRHQCNDLLKKNGRTFSSVLIITDENVLPLFLDDVVASMKKEYSNVYSYAVPGSEKAKSFDHFYACQTFALECDLDRNSLIIALGGGVVGDLAGFVAATYMRGIPFIQLPTTLLAHDSSVGGKVAINHPLGKNMIGAFYQPEAVIYDSEMLATLPEKEWRSGFAEVIKHALIWDKDFYSWLKKEIKDLKDLKDDRLHYALEKGIMVKAAVVSEDETEKGIRAYLNFGHTVGHAIEALKGYGTLTHGDCVAIGMLFAIEISEDYYSLDLNLESFRKWFQTFGFPSFPKDLHPSDILQLMKKDKKSQSGNIKMVLMKEIGKVETVSLEDDYILQFLKRACGE